MTSTQMRADRDALARQHLDRLATVPALTDCPLTRNHAKGLAEKVRLYAEDRGMLGRNGIGPAIDSCLSQAKSLGFLSAKRVAA